MSKHNYSQYSNKNNNANVAEEELNPIIEAVEETMNQVEETPVVVETPAIPEPVAAPVVEPKVVEGTVVGCTKLNVRSSASLFSDVVCVLNANDKITVDPAKSNKDWLKVRTATGADGYCMSKYVEVKQ